MFVEEVITLSKHDRQKWNPNTVLAVSKNAPFLFPFQTKIRMIGFSDF